MSDSAAPQQKERFAPKQPVDLAPPKDDVITQDYLAKCDVNRSNRKWVDEKVYRYKRWIPYTGRYQSIPPNTQLANQTLTNEQGDVFDVSGKDTYSPGKNYHVFTGKEPNRALGLSSLKPEDCISDYSNLSEKEIQVLNDWHTFFSKRYNIVGRLQPESNASL
ncbi:hypothetical protein N0V90_003546 [Kalmusia sp. IMI 367209]|nr:hypothetical protein N0V90_003546 [Kalmusia sp. IMI 367209]